MCSPVAQVLSVLQHHYLIGHFTTSIVLITFAMNDFNLELSIPFPTARETEVAYQVLRVDKEPPRSGVVKKFEQKNNILQVSFSSTEVRKLRVGVTSFFENLILVTETMQQFGPPQPKYNYY
ncbi:hypothetical protein KPH14_008451 [Odynerus spinipes]|uniref:L antigen family member 3 n=1 Tax=Odynerus spinipes TaxID=1348599 RepID=A0AAD9RE83_9HYME|nr:hypothetical protein KPH14_008451 [Odynerus spinipes]